MGLILRCVLLLLMLLGSHAVDLYKVLGVDKSASQQEIKKAFHKLSLKHHPDKNPSKNAQTRFAEISNAYEILSDEDKRRNYDLTGDPSGREGSYPGGSEGSYPGGGFSGGFSGFPGKGGRSNRQQRTYNYNFQGGQQFQGWFDPGQYWTEYKASTFDKRKASQDSDWGVFGFPSFGKSTSDPAGFAGDLFGALFGAAKKGFQNYRDSFQTSKTGQGKGNEGETGFSKAVEQLDGTQFQQKVLGQDREMWLIFFYGPLVPRELDEKVAMLNLLALRLMGLLKVGAVSCQQYGRLCREHAPSTLQSNAPTLYIYPYGTTKASSPVLYTGSWTEKAVEDFSVKLIPNLSTQLDSQKFVKQWSKLRDLPAAVLFTRKKETPSKWRALSCIFRRRVQFYDIHVGSDMDSMAAKQFGIQSYPAVLGVLANKEEYLLAGEHIFAHSGHKMVEELRSFLEDLEMKSRVAGSGKSGPDSGSDVPLLTKANSEFICGSSTPLCVIAVVDSMREAEKAKQILLELSHKTLIRKVESYEKKNPCVSYSLVDASKQPNFVQSFNPGKLKGEDSILIAYKPRKAKYVLLKGPLRFEEAEAFVVAALGGDITFQTLHRDPVLA